MNLIKKFTNDNGEEEIWEEKRFAQNGKVVVGDKIYYETDEDGNEFKVVDYQNGYTDVEGFLTEEEVEYIKSSEVEEAK